MPILYSLAPNLVNERGHSATYQEAIFLSLSSITIISCELNVFLPINHFFSNPPLYFHKWFKNNQKHLDLFLDYCRLVRTKKHKQRIFLQENFNLKEFLFLSIALLFFGNKKDSLWLIFRYDFSQLRYKGSIHRFLIKCLGRKIKPFTDSELIAKQVKNVTLLPIPHAPSPTQRKEVKALISCLWPGEPREAKGKREILTLLNSTDPKAKEYKMMFSEELTYKKKEVLVKTLPKIVAQEKYIAQLMESDVLFLPYHETMYKSSTSGIFVEGIIAGKIPFVKKGTWLSYELERFDLKELIVDWENPLFFTYIHPLIFSKEIERKLHIMQHAYAEFHSKKNFGEILAKAIAELSECV